MYYSSEKNRGKTTLDHIQHITQGTGLLTHTCWDANTPPQQPRADLPVLLPANSDFWKEGCTETPEEQFQLSNSHFSERTLKIFTKESIFLLCCPLQCSAQNRAAASGDGLGRTNSPQQTRLSSPSPVENGEASSCLVVLLEELHPSSALPAPEAIAARSLRTPGSGPVYSRAVLLALGCTAALPSPGVGPGQLSPHRAFIPISHRCSCPASPQTKVPKGTNSLAV